MEKGDEGSDVLFDQVVYDLIIVIDPNLIDRTFASRYYPGPRQAEPVCRQSYFLSETSIVFKTVVAVVSHIGRVAIRYFS